MVAVTEERVAVMSVEGRNVHVRFIQHNEQYDEATTRLVDVWDPEPGTNWQREFSVECGKDHGVPVDRIVAFDDDLRVRQTSDGRVTTYYSGRL